MNIDILGKDGKKVSSIELDKDVFEGEVKQHLFYEVVKMQLANRRSGTACTKTRAEVSGGGAKPWKQKGSGRARTGTNRSPLWRHGGVVFGPRPRDYSYLVPKKVRKEALKNALRLKAREGLLRVFDEIELAGPRTKEVLGLIKDANLTKALIVAEAENKFLRLAVRNLKGFKFLAVGGINVYDILNHNELVMTRGAFEKVEALVK
jgi:large subunit ribosomal protein L4